MTRAFAGRRILLGVTGGIASYKSVRLARLLAQAEAEVDVVMTRAAREFVGAITFEAVTGRPVSTELLESGHALDHIRLARAAHAVVVAPASADFLARAAHGRADDLLAAALLATTAPVLLVPAMNDRMWSHAQTQRNVAHLRELGYQVLEPDEGPLAIGEGSGPGRMPEPETILAHLARVMAPIGILRGRHIVVTAGPTREAVDPVRYLSNRSSGRMGVELAAAAWRRGARVTLIAGPLSIPLPVGIDVVQIETSGEMAAAVSRALSDADALIMAAAPADFRPAQPAAQKIKKSRDANMSLALEPTADILLETAKQRPRDAVIVGFALETQDALANGRKKLEAKSLDLIVVNDATEPGAGFGVETNRVTLVDREGEEELPLMTKSAVADAILDRVETMLHGR
jgi:phosphopantothenoylcysteine decarboxylase/phosphopantothenate--cysteine ligase